MADAAVRVGWLPTEEARARYEAALVPALGSASRPGPFADRSVVAEARDGDRIVGLALGQVLPRPTAGEVLCLAVEAPFRRRGVGTALLRAVEGALAEAGCTAVQGRWRSDWAGADGLATFLAAAGWGAPVEHRLLYKAGQAAAGQPWVGSVELPAGYALDDWASATDGDREAARQLLAADPAAVPLTPFQRPDLASPTLSLWLRHEGAVVGWIVALRHSPTVVEYAGLYVAPLHRRTRLALALLAEAVRRHLVEREARVAAGGPAWGTGVFVVDPDNHAMRAFADGFLGTDREVRAVEWLSGRPLTG